MSASEGEDGDEGRENQTVAVGGGMGGPNGMGGGGNAVNGASAMNNGAGGNGAGNGNGGGESMGKKHVCPTCNKRFNRPSSLRIHVNTHTGATREWFTFFFSG